MTKVAASGASAAPTTRLSDGLQEAATRLENLAHTYEEVRRSVAEDAAHSASAFDQLFTAVALLNPRHAADTIRKVTGFVEPDV